MALTEAEVVWGYRYILGREPENMAIVRAHAATMKDCMTFRTALLRSEEFSRLYTQFRRSRAGVGTVAVSAPGSNSLPPDAVFKPENSLRQQKHPEPAIRGCSGIGRNHPRRCRRGNTQKLIIEICDSRAGD